MMKYIIILLAMLFAAPALAGSCRTGEKEFRGMRLCEESGELHHPDFRENIRFSPVTVFWDEDTGGWMLGLHIVQVTPNKEVEYKVMHGSAELGWFKFIQEPKPMGFSSGKRRYRAVKPLDKEDFALLQQLVKVEKPVIRFIFEPVHESYLNIRERQALSMILDRVYCENGGCR